MRPRRVSRRAFLGGTGAAGLFTVLLHHQAFRFLRPLLRSTAVAATVEQPLSEDELKTLRALSLVLIPSTFAANALNGEADNPAESVIGDILREHATDPEFRAAAAFLDRRSDSDHQARFAVLDTDRRRALVDRVLQPYTQRTSLSAAYFYLTTDGRAARHLWQAVAKPIITDFYTGPLGWQVVGYSRQPGQCSNLVDYQFPVS